ncbi:helix-turn-helix domain-containing protein [Halobacteriaceae archaeon GCM10025711]
MPTVVEFTVPASACAIGRSLQVTPETTIEIERVVPTKNAVMPLFWAWGGDADAFAAAVRTEDAVENLTVVEEVDGGVLYAADWDESAMGTLRGIIDTDGVLLGATATVTGWRFRVQFPEGDHATRFQEYCNENGVPITVDRVSALDNPRERNGFGLTDAQREVLVAAYDRGYFDEPRTVGLTELASALGVSDVAVSRRLRRGLKELLGRTVAPGRQRWNGASTEDDINTLTD